MGVSLGPGLVLSVSDPLISCSDSGSEFSGRERRPYFFLPNTNFGLTSRSGKKINQHKNMPTIKLTLKNLSMTNYYFSLLQYVHT